MPSTRGCATGSPTLGNAEMRSKVARPRRGVDLEPWAGLRPTNRWRRGSVRPPRARRGKRHSPHVARPELEQEIGPIDELATTNCLHSRGEFSLFLARQRNWLVGIRCEDGDLSSLAQSVGGQVDLAVDHGAGDHLHGLIVPMFPASVHYAAIGLNAGTTQVDSARWPTPWTNASRRRDDRALTTSAHQAEPDLRRREAAAQRARQELGIPCFHHKRSARAQRSREHDAAARARRSA